MTSTAKKAAAADGRSVSNLTDRILREWLTGKGFLGQEAAQL